MSGLGRKRKTFEELLEEELSKEQQQMVIVIQYLVCHYFGYSALLNFSISGYPIQVRTLEKKTNASCCGI